MCWHISVQVGAFMALERPVVWNRVSSANKKWTTSKNWQEVASFTFPSNKSLKTKIKITVAKGIVSLFYIASLLNHAN